MAALQTAEMGKSTQGWLNGLIGVAIFSASLPATRLAVQGFDPVFVTVARASIAGLLGSAFLYALRQRRPDETQIIPLIIVAVGVVVGFPLLTALALKSITSAHSVVYIGLLPLSTALFGVIRAQERPPMIFWLFSLLGSGCVVGFALVHGGADLALGDALMLGAIIVCGLGYAEGAKLSRTLGGWQVISWALLLSLPIMLVLVLVYWPDTLGGIKTSAWLGLAYVSLFSMLIGFVFWYRGLAQGGIAAVGQLQLLQPFMGLGLAALLLEEEVSSLMIISTIGVVICVAAARQFAIARK